MYRLILKDLIINKFGVILTLLGCAVFGGLTSIIGLHGIIYFFLTNMSVMVMVLAIEGTNNKTNSDMISLSLPISKGRFIVSKYVGIIIYFAMTSIVVALALSAVSYFKFGTVLLEISIRDVVMSLSCVMILYSFYLPLLFKFGYDRMRIFSTVLYLAMFMLPSLFTKVASKYLTREQFISFMYNTMFMPYVVFFIIASGMYLISMIVSKFCFRDLQ